MDLDRPDYRASGTRQVPAGACCISLPSRSGVFSKVTERYASIG